MPTTLSTSNVSRARWTWLARFARRTLFGFVAMARGMVLHSLSLSSSPVARYGLVLPRRVPFLPELARDLLAQISEALAAVHAAGIVHRDVKASNVLLTDDGVAKLTDFGIARGNDVRGSTSHGSLLGTPAYMAPEGPIDPRSDLYSLGVLYYELLSGVLPFTGTDYREVIRAHVEAMPDLTRLPATERGLTGWLLSKNPYDRPQSAEILLESLRSKRPGSTEAVAVSRPTSGPSLSADPIPRPDGNASSALDVKWPPSPAGTPTPIPAPAPSDATHKATDSPTMRPGVRQGNGWARSAVPALGVFLLLALGAVVVYAIVVVAAAGPRPGLAGAPVLIAVSVLALGAIAVTATLVVSRTRTRATKGHGLAGLDRCDERSTVPRRRGQ